jgi:hypothetical protein
MSFLKNLFGGARLDGAALAQSQELKEMAQIDLLAQFDPPQPLHATQEQTRWSRVLPRSYADEIALYQKQGWLERRDDNTLAVTAAGLPFVQAWRARLAREKEVAIAKVREALAQRMTSEALTVRRQYENRLPLGKAGWTGPDPQPSHSALTRQIFFLEATAHRMLRGLSPQTVEWLKAYAAEQHLWGTSWRLSPEDVPDYVQAELAQPGVMDGVEGAYWKAQQLGLYVDNQETWRRCKGGDHVRRIEIVGPEDEYTCAECKAGHGKQYLVARVPELPHPGCTSPRGCRCRYEPVLETIEEIPLVM